MSRNAREQQRKKEQQEAQRQQQGNKTTSTADDIDDNFLALYNGKDVIMGSIVAWEDTFKFLISQPKRKMHACLMAFIQPKKFFWSGKTAKGTGDDRGVDEKIVQFLPVLSGSATKGSARGSDIGNTINYSMITRVAMMTLQLNGLFSKFTVGWCQKYGGIPTAVTEKSVALGLKVNNLNFSEEQDPTISKIKQTGYILWTNVSEFKSEQSYWADEISDLPTFDA
jgi:hypothetical protein